MTQRMTIDQWKDASPTPTESIEQQRLIQWATALSGAYPELELLYHIPNEGKRKRVTGARLRAEGLKKGVPDLCLPVARGSNHGLYIEMKRTKGSKVTPEQMEWLDKLRVQGYAVAICRGWEEASEIIMKYLKAGDVNAKQP